MLRWRALFFVFFVSLLFAGRCVRRAHPRRGARLRIKLNAVSEHALTYGIFFFFLCTWSGAVRDANHTLDNRAKNLHSRVY